MIRDIIGKRIVWLGGTFVVIWGICLISMTSTPEKTFVAKMPATQETETLKEEGLETLTPENYKEKIRASKSVLVMWYHSDYDGRPPFSNEDGKKYMAQLKEDLGAQLERYYLMNIAKLEKPWNTLKEETRNLFHPCLVLYVNNEIANVMAGSPRRYEKDKWDEVVTKDKESILKSLREKAVEK
ncbi:MAG: hypothetical protein ACK4WF_00170 [Candidatus Brocadiales bacterium]